MMSTISANDPSELPDVHGIQAVSEARTHQPHVMLWSLGLRGGDSVGVLERLKRNRLRSAIPVMVGTGRDPEVAEQTAREYGAIAFIQKPVKQTQ